MRDRHITLTTHPCEQLVHELDVFIPLVASATGAPGLSAALMVGDEEPYTWSVGTADHVTGAPLVVDSVFRGGSLSKIYTLTAVLQLVEAGVLDLYASVNRYLDAFQIANPLGEREITLYDLLTFRSGLATDTTHYRVEPPTDLETHLIECFTHDAIQEYDGAYARWATKVGAAYHYSNCGIALVGYIIERHNPDGLSFAEYVHANIIEPMGLSATVLPLAATSVHVPPALLARIASGYARFGEILVPSPRLFTWDYPACGVLTTPRDHVRMLNLYAHGGLCSGTRLLREETVRFAVTPQTSIGGIRGPDCDWTSGLVLLSGNGGRSFGMGGAVCWGWTADARAVPAAGVSIVAACNQWDMVAWHNPARRPATDLICDYVEARLLGGNPVAGADRGNRNSAWPRTLSYSVAVLLAERTNAFLGAGNRALDDDLANFAREAALLNRSVDEFDEAGFRAGIQDMCNVSLTQDGVHKASAEGRLEVAFHELDLAYHAFGGYGPMPIPLKYWTREPSPPFGPLSSVSIGS